MRSNVNATLCMQSVIVSNFSVFNCMGRMSTAFLPDRMGNKIVARTDFLVLGHVACAACSLLAAHSCISSLPFVAVCTGARPPPACSCATKERFPLECSAAFASDASYTTSCM
jgi:hypothetical protein